MVTDFMTEGEFLNTAQWLQHPDITPPQTDLIKNFDGKFIGFGSCFAQNLKDNVTPLGFEYWYNRDICGHYSAGSLANVLEIVATERGLTDDDLYFVDGQRDTVLAPAFYFKKWYFGDDAAERSLVRMRELVIEARIKIQECSFIAVTLGTARVTKLAETGKIMNTLTGVNTKHCTFEMTTAEDNIGDLERVYQYISDIRGGDVPPIFLTISPQRYLFGKKIVVQDKNHKGPVRDPFVDNMLAKSILRVAAEEFTLRHPETVQYFPSYELVIDEMRGTEPMSHYNFTHIEQVHTVQRVVKKFLLSNCSNAVIEQLNLMEELKRAVDYISELFGGGISMDHHIVVDLFEEQVSRFEQLDQKLSPVVNKEFEKLWEFFIVGQDTLGTLDEKIKLLRAYQVRPPEMTERLRKLLERASRLVSRNIDAEPADAKTRLEQFAELKKLDMFSDADPVGRFWGPR